MEKYIREYQDKMKREIDLKTKETMKAWYKLMERVYGAQTIN